MLCCYKQIAVFAAGRLFPKSFQRRVIAKTFMQCNSGSKHIGIIFFVYDVFAKSVLIDKSRRKFIKTVATSTLPVYAFSNATFIFAADNFIKAYFAMGISVFAHFNANPPAPHFVRHSCGCATA